MWISKKVISMKIQISETEKYVFKTTDKNASERQNIEFAPGAPATDEVEACTEKKFDKLNSHEFAPSSPATADNQGDLHLCTRSAISKAVVESFDKNTCGVGRKLDMNQNAVFQVLCNEHKDGVGKWPTDFDNTSYQLQEMKDSSCMRTELSVKEVKKSIFVTDMTSRNNIYQYVLVHYLGNRRSHCMYVKSLKKNYIKCINSQGAIEPEPKIPLNNPNTKFYRVICQATKVCPCTNICTCTNGTSPHTKKPSVANIKKASQTVQKVAEKVSMFSVGLGITVGVGICGVGLAIVKGLRG